MIVADFHVHSTFSVDGMSTMEQHCIMAMQKGIKKICFTEHVDYNIAEYNVGKVKDNRKQNFNIKEYFNEIERLRITYRIDIFFKGRYMGFVVRWLCD